MSTTETFVPYMPHGEATRESVDMTLQGALNLLGPDGEHWLQGQLRGFEPRPGGGFTGTYCVVAALEQAAPDYESYAAARDVLKLTAGSNHLDRWNNHADFGQVRNAIGQAQAVMERRLVLPLPEALRLTATYPGLAA